MLLLYLTEDENTHHGFSEGRTLTHLPDNISRIEISLNMEYVNECHATVDYKSLTKMLQCSSRKLSSIIIYEHEPRAPEYLAFLTAASQAADKLFIEEFEVADSYFFDSDCGYSSLMSCLLVQNGPKTLNLKLDTEITAHHAQLLFQGVAHSPCLESLELQCVVFEDAEVATDALLDALKQNQNLEKLYFCDCNIVRFEEIFRAAMSKANKVRSIQGYKVRLDFGVALDALRSQGCQLRSLACYNMDMTVDGRGDSDNGDVDLMDVQLDSSDLTDTWAKFESLTNSQLNSNHIQNFSALDTLLIGDTAKLQDLSLRSCNIDENCIIEFFHKIPQMKCIRRLELAENPFLKESNGWMDILSNTIQRNTSLECLCFEDREALQPERKSFYSGLEVALSLNRAWRRFKENDNAQNNSKTLPPNLWPLVLERATKISYFSCKDFKTPELTSVRPDAVFWFLRERMDVLANPICSQLALHTFDVSLFSQLVKFIAWLFTAWLRGGTPNPPYQPKQS